MPNPAIARHVLIVALIFVAVLLSPEKTFAQAMRYELGQRVKRFERLFENVCHDETARGKVLPSLESAVRDFFSMQFGRACKKIDAATAALHENTSSELAEFLPVSVTPERRLLDISATGLTWTFKPQYGEFPNQQLQVTVGLYSSKGQLVQQKKIPLSAGTGAFTFPTDGGSKLVEGDYQLVCHHQQKDLAIRQTISIVRDVEKRLQAIDEIIGGVDTERTSPLARSFRYRRSVIRNLTKGGTPETDVPVFEILAELEQWAHSGKPLFTVPANAAKSSSSRIVLTAGRRSLPCRVSLPKAALDGTPTPLVIVLHGAGGSENMFYEAYGAGKVVKLADERQWILVSPRISLLGLALSASEMVDSLTALGIAVDRQQIFVVGHSMGGGATMKLASQETPLRALAVLGGSGSSRVSKANEKTKCFIAAGDRDFGRHGASALAQALEKRGADVKYKTFAKTEHLGIVQVALDDVFSFFDEAAKK